MAMILITHLKMANWLIETRILNILKCVVPNNVSNRILSSHTVLRNGMQAFTKGEKKDMYIKQRASDNFVTVHLQQFLIVSHSSVALFQQVARGIWY
jgi:hypothetical protein